MLNWYRNWLVRQNEKTGHPAWWLVAALGLAMILVWIKAAMPWVCYFVGIFPSVGNITHSANGLIFVAFGRQFEARAAEIYFALVLLGIALAKAGYSLFLIGSHFGRGYIYVMPRRGEPLGSWVKI